MKVLTKSFLAISFIVQVKAQFHDTTGLNKQTNSLKIEAIANRVSENWEMNAMTVATMRMQATETKLARERSIELGEATDPLGNPIFENTAPIVRPIDPRTPQTFGDLFLREEIVNEIMEEIENSLTEEEKGLIASIDNGEDELEEYDNLMLIHSLPRAMCGKDRKDAENKCGNTCNPEIPFCERYAQSEEERMMPTGEAFKYFDKCFADISCGAPDDETILTMANDETCAPLRMNNPCPTSCDCYGSKNKRRKCKEACQQTDNVNIIKCAKMRAKGDKKRKNKIIKHLELNKNACDFNVYFNHPLQSNEEIQGVQLPGLFGTH